MNTRGQNEQRGQAEKVAHPFTGVSVGSPSQNV